VAVPGLLVARKTRRAVAETRGGQPAVAPGAGEGGGVGGGGDGVGLGIRSGGDGGILLSGAFLPELLLVIPQPSEGSERGGVPTSG